MQLFVSNRQEHLYQFCKLQLFSGSHPFARRLVITPHWLMRRSLEHQLASDPELGISTGIEWMDEYRFMAYLMGLFSSTAAVIPTKLELSFAIENQLQQRQEQQGRKADKKRAQLADSLAMLFERYGRYGRSMFNKWPSDSEAEQQKELWDSLFSEGYTYPYRFLDNGSACQPLPPNMQLHFFCPSHLCHLHEELLRKASLEIPVFIYLLSPCQMYWSDQVSGRERKRLLTYWQRKGAREEQQQQLAEILTDTNPLLAQLGKVGRETVKQLEEWDAMTHASYSLLEESNRNAPPRVLAALQADCLLLRNPTDSPPLCVAPDDDSIQFHAVPSPAREIQVLYDLILDILHRHAHDPEPIQPCDVLVMIPDLGRYVPYIEATFGRSDSLLPRQLLDLSLEDQSPFIQSFLHLLMMAEGRWEAPALYRLFRSPFFKKRHHLSESDLIQIRSWIQQAPIYWGQNPSHRQTFLRRAHCKRDMLDKSATGTWDEGLRALLQGFASPGALTINLSDGELIGKLIMLVHSLQADLEPLQEGKRLSLDDWSVYLHCLCDAYLEPVDDESSSHRDLLLSCLKEIQRANRCIPSATYSYHSVHKRLVALLRQHEITRDEGNLQAVRFCALRPRRAIPARMIALVGMDEGVFPRSEHHALDLLRQCPSDYCPTQAEQDRYLFLECLLSARDHLLIIHSNSSPTDGKEQHPCLPVTELKSYLNAFYRLNDQPAGNALTSQHPFHPFDPAYFQQEAKLISYSQTYFRAAQVLFRNQLVQEPQPNRFHLQHKREIAKCIDLRDLEMVMRDPIKCYLNRSLGIYLTDDHQRKIRPDEPFTLSPLDRYRLRMESLHEPIEQVVARATQQGKLPLGTFAETAKEQLQDDMAPTVNFFAQEGGLHLLPHIQLHEHCVTAKEIGPRIWQLPAIRLGNFMITGTINRIASEGLLVDGNGSFEDGVRSWPTLLVMSLLQKQLAALLNQHIPSRLIFYQKGRDKPLILEQSSEHLTFLINHYQRCLSEASPLHADWAKLFLTGDGAIIASKMQKDLTESKQRHTRWLLGEQKSHDLCAWISDWIPTAKELYGPLEALWREGS